jgi:hypothetical protein
MIAGPDTASSGVLDTATVYSAANPYIYRAWAVDAAGNALPDSASFPFTWSISDANLFRTTLGNNLNRHPGDTVVLGSPGNVGIARVMVTTVGGATAVRLVNVRPAPATGFTIAPSNVLTRPGQDVVNITRPSTAGRPVYDGNTRVFVDGVETFIQSTVNNALVTAAVTMPPLTRTGAVPVQIGNMAGANIWFEGTLTAGASATSTVDGLEPNDAAPSVASSLTSAGTGSATRWLVLSGADCAAGVGGAGTDCRDWLAFTNSSALDRVVTIAVSWFTAADIDANAFMVDGTTPASDAGSTRSGGLGTTPAEQYDISVPPGQTRRVRVQVHAPRGATATIVRYVWTIS